ncbi:PepSY-associated TM helix domain-containing protein [Roseibium aggregatum]|uniref:PepSY domain-containing protein n=1 Tax=Roseibium aggregatum TaxID=187304 RepID=A0A939EK04_9HYPH|nr:PepSY-associated TM helix domain-containing protein [Roseibium aggregatum]MBN9673089.1 PepSY domain-containing protein [Roseibium aggregatum]
MTFKRAIFWTHLAVGIVFGIVVVFMSATGVLLTYERQIETRAVNSAVQAPANTSPLDIDGLVAKAEENGALAGHSVVVSSTEGAAVKVSKSRRESFLMNPYTGEQMKGAGEDTKSFFRTVMLLHRWFALSGEGRDIGKAITGASNLAFLFLLASGFYLWWPKKWKWSFIRQNLLFRRNLPTSKARDYNWHHVFGIWALVPLLAVVISGVVISYPWASDLVVAIYGEADPARPGQSADAVPQGQGAGGGQTVSFQSIFNGLRAEVPDWTAMTFKLPQDNAKRLVVTVDTGNGAQLSRQRTFTLSRVSGEQLGVVEPEDQSAGRRARVFLRFLHTGEVYGVVGQTLAGLASLAALFLGYTGFTLAYRRLVQPLFRRRRAGHASNDAR